MAVAETYSLASDFGSNLNTSQFNTELENDVTITTEFSYLQVENDDVDIYLANQVVLGG